MGLIQNKVTVSQPVSHIVVENAGGLRGETGSQGPEGPAGAPGEAATVSVGTTTTLPAGSSATVTNTGTTSDAVFNFGIPKGDKGDKGDAGAGLVITGSVATYADLPNDLGPEDAGKAYFVEADGKLYVWSGTQFPADGEGSQFEGPQGPAGQDGQDGADGQAATITVGSTTTLTPGSSATVTNSGTTSAAILDFGIPAGAKGETGEPGPANTLSIGTVEGGDTAAATITGTAPNQTLNLTLPKGDKGDTGEPGPAPEAYETATGNPITLTDAGYSVKELNKFKGDTYQQQYTGKNVLDIFASDKTPGTTTNNNGVDYTLNSDGTITVYGTATARSDYTILLSTGHRIDGTNKKLVGEIVSGTFSSSVDFWIYDGSYDKNSYIACTEVGTPLATNTLESGVEYVRVRVRIQNGGSANCVVRMMVIDSSISDLSYEPYVGGIPAPNPSYPQGVQTATGLQTITISDGGGNSQNYTLNLGKNLFNKSDFNGLQAALQESNNSVEYSNLNRLFFIQCSPNTTYTVQKRNDGNVNRFAVGSSSIKPAANTSVTAILRDNSATSITYTTGASDTWLIVQYFRTQDTAVTEQQVLDSIQVEVGSTATAYSTYFTPIELCKIGTAEDYIYKNNNTWYLHKEVDKIIFDGSENWQVVAGAAMTSYGLDDALSGDYHSDAAATYLSNSFKTISTNDRYVDNTLFTNAFHRVVCTVTSITSLANFKTWLDNSNLVVYFTLATPTDTQITNTDLISSLNALNQAPLYEGDTNITVSATSPNLAAPVDLDYWTMFKGEPGEATAQTIDLSAYVNPAFSTQVNRCYLSVYGKVAVIEAYMKIGSSVGSYTTILTLPEQYRPGHNQTIFMSSETNPPQLIPVLLNSTNGNVQNAVAPPSSNIDVRCGGSWIIGA